MASHYHLEQNVFTKAEGMIEKWRKLPSDELHCLCLSPCVVKVIKLRRLRRARFVTWVDKLCFLQLLESRIFHKYSVDFFIWLGRHLVLVWLITVVHLFYCQYSHIYFPLKVYCAVHVMIPKVNVHLLLHAKFQICAASQILWLQ
jgi:hypothetical protein